MYSKKKDWSSGFVSSNPMGSTGEPFANLEEIYDSPSGFCRLFRAERYGRFHVLKALKQEFVNQPFAEQMLHKEFVISYPLDHPHICRTLAEEMVPPLGRVIVQEYVDGINLRQLMERGELTPGNARSLLTEVCSALSYLHSRQIIHRDLKPENIMVTRNGQHAKLIDFNLSDGDNFSQLKESAGTRFYIAPEVVDAHTPADQRADIYSLGIVIGEMAELLKDKALASLSRQCTRRRREERLPSADAVAALLTPGRRGNRKLGLVALLLLLLTAGGGLFFYHASRDATGASQAALYPTYGNCTLSPRCLHLLEEQQRLWQQQAPTAPSHQERQSLQERQSHQDRQSLQEMKRDSLLLINRLREALHEEYPLAIQRESKLYARQWLLIEQEVKRIYHASIRSKRPQ